MPALVFADATANVCGGVSFVILIWLAYGILFLDRRRRQADEAYAAAGGSLPTFRWLAYAVFGLVGVAVYAALLGVPAYLLVRFAPVVWTANRQGLSPQEISFGGQLAEVRAMFGDLAARLPALEAARHDPGDPRWPELQRDLAARLGGGRRFGRDLGGAVIDWGRSLAAEQGAKPPVTVPDALLAAARRLSGGDDFPARMDRFRGAVAAAGYSTAEVNESVDGYTVQAMALNVFYPNDDIAYLALSEGFRPPPLGENRDDDQTALGLFAAALVVVYALLVQRGMRLLTISLAGRLVGLRQVPLFRRFEREAFDPYRFLISAALVLTATAALAWVWIDPYYVLTYRHPGPYLATVLWNVLIGGVLVDGLNNLVSVGLIRRGVDPFRILLDNVAVAGVAVLILLYFQNSWFSIATSLAMGLAQSVVMKALALRDAED